MEGSQQIKLEFLSGGGEMGERIRAFDWSKTPLGPPETWEQSLKTCVRIILTSRQPMFVWWGKELINIYNDPYKAIVGGKHPTALGQPAAVVWKEIWDHVEPRAQTAMLNNEGTYDEALLLIMERYGYAEETYYTFSYSPVPGDHGGTNGIICANTDDTQRIVNERALKTLRDLGIMTANRKNAEEIYKKSAEVLAQNNRDFPFFLIYKIENEGKLGKLIAHSGMTSEQVLFPSVIDVMNPEKPLQAVGEVVKFNKWAMDELPSEFREVLPTGHWPIHASKLIFLPITNNGRKYPFAVMVSALNPYRQYDESYQSLFELFADQLGSEISNVYAYEEERKRAEALAEIDKAKTAFFSNISHEFRTPLTLILGPLEDFLNEVNGSSTTHAKENIEAAHRNAVRLLRLVNSLLDFSRIEAGRVKATFQPVDLASLTSHLAGSFRSIIEKAGILFKVDCSPRPFPVYLDKEMWEKIVLNLISNAFKYTLKGEICVKLSIEGEYAVLSVEDTGVGIPEKELPRMFERFHRIENSGGRTHEGTGIGLSLVHELVKLHQGAVKVESVEGKGSTFTVQIPLGKDHLEAEQTVEVSHEESYDSVANAFLAEAATLVENSLNYSEHEDMFSLTDEQKNHSGIQEELFTEKKATVLLVDDNADMLTYVKQLLDKQFNVVTAKHGKQALEKISIGLPDLIVSDIMMPVMDGHQLLKTVKESPSTRHIPVILLSARAGEEAKVEGIEAGADDYLVKPFSAKELLSRVRSQIKIRKIQTAAEHHIRHLFMQAPVAIAIYRGPSFVVELINDKALEMWGRRREEVLGRPVFEVFPQATAESRAVHTRVFETGERHIDKEHKSTFIRNDQPHTGYFDLIYEPLTDLEGNVTGLIIAAHEVTDEIKAQTKIRESQERLRLAIELANIGTWDYDPVSDVLMCSERTVAIFGFSSNENITLSSVIEIIKGEERERVLEVIGKAMTAGSDGNYEMEYGIFNRNRKEERTLRVYGKALFDEQGIAERLIGTVMDVTEERQYKESLERQVADRTFQLEEKNRELRRQNYFVETILDSSVDVMAVFDQNLCYVTLNKASYELYEIKQEDIIGKNVLDVFPQVTDSGMYEDLKKALLGQTIHNPAYKSKVLGRDFENFYIPLKNQQEEVYGVLAIGHDVSRLVEASRKLEEKNAALLKSNNDLEQFAHVASHDLQEPLRKIQTFSELLTKNLNQEAEAKKYLSKIEYSAARMQTLIKDVLNYSRLSKAEERKVDTDLNQLLETIKVDFELLIEQKNATIIHSKLPTVKAIPLQILQLFSNLISNSLKFSRTVPAPVIQVSSRQLATEDLSQYPQLNGNYPHIQLEFKDNGIGFDPQYKQQIFTIFQRLHDKQSYSGTGIGLALCKKIVENHRGMITADSETDKGAVFTIILPIFE
uniref:histidine kinase n=1 Tax=uncultured bacterium A1Q1_fos_1093 TaxID=1256542 RepID=L7VZ17_9BACT|nr:PAS/PAC domain protein [uncultured bacterium A1Q1_fos_1093]